MQRSSMDIDRQKAKTIECFLPASIAYHSSVKAKLHQDKVRLIVDNKVHFGELLSIMSYIPGMDLLYGNYIKSIDKWVIVTESAYYFTIYPDANYALYQDEVEKYSIVENVLAGYVVMLMMVKNIPSTNLNYLHEFLKKRLGALSFHIGPSARGIGYETVLNRFNEEELFNLNEIITYFPQFKKAVFELVCIASTKELAHMKVIFENSCMTIFTLILEFESTSEPTLLHIQPPVVRDYLKWLSAYKKVKNEYGDKWRFYKLINPTGVDTSCKEYNNLACAAVSWALNQRKYANLEKMSGIRSSEHFKKLAAVKLPPQFVIQKHGTVEGRTQNNPNTAPHDEEASGSN